MYINFTYFISFFSLHHPKKHSPKTVSELVIYMVEWMDEEEGEKKEKEMGDEPFYPHIS